MIRLTPLVLAALALGGCFGAKPPAPEVRYVAVAVRPVLPPECQTANPPRPVLLTGKPGLGDAEALGELKDQARADDRHITRLETLRDVCRAGVTAYHEKVHAP